jgi:hypothetical protein
MTDTQLLTLAVAIIFPLSMLIYSNSRITEAKETLRAEMTAMKGELKADVALMRTELNNKLDHLLEIVSKHDERLGR